MASKPSGPASRLAQSMRVAGDSAKYKATQAKQGRTIKSFNVGDSTVVDVSTGAGGVQTRARGQYDKPSEAKNDFRAYTADDMNADSRSKNSRARAVSSYVKNYYKKNSK